MTSASVGVADQWLAGVSLEQSSVLFVIGQGGGDLSGALQRRDWTGKVIVVDPTRPFEDLERSLLSIEPDSANPVVAIEPEIARAHREASRAAARHIARAWFGARANQEAKRQNGGRYLLNTLRNYEAIAGAADAGALTGAFAGVPALLVAAGPSLDGNLAGIVEHRRKAIVIAADTALRPLLAAGVQPDFVVALDPSEANACHLVDLPPCPETHLVAEGSLDPEALRHFAGRTWFFRVANHQPWPWMIDGGLNCAQLRAWGSVLTSAFDLALGMGCDPIVFTGADLAFTDGKPYARGTWFEEGWRRGRAWGEGLEAAWAARLAESPEVYEAGVDGRQVRTAPHLRAFRDWIVTAAGEASDRTVVNATGGGMLVGGAITQATIDSALAHRPAVSEAIVEATVARHAASASRKASLRRPLVSRETRRAWQMFASVSDAAINAALDQQPQPAEREEPVAEVVPSKTQRGDAAYLEELARAAPLEFVTFSDPGQDLLAELRDATAALSANRAVVVVDDVGTSVGVQVRRAVDALLCERADLWVDYRRFVDHASRLTVLRGESHRFTPDQDPDFAKRDPGHEATAQRLAPFIHQVLAPASVVDVGGGGGFWLKALNALGVEDTCGIAAGADVPDPDRRFDVCLCLEVAQRLAPPQHLGVIASCVRLSDVVVFSSTPPGVPGSSPHDRPMPYWAELFWAHGYVIEDNLRPQIEQRWDYPASVFDLLVTFRRQFTPEQALDPSLRRWALAAAARLYDLHLQKTWWATLAHDRAVTQPPQVPPQSRLTPWPVPASRLMAATETARVFRFRTDAARWYLTHPSATLRVLENGRAIGGWSRWRDEVTLTSTDGTDPRTNGRVYALVLPAHVAWAESQALADTLQNEW